MKKFKIIAIMPLRNEIELMDIKTSKVFYFKSHFPVIGTFIWGAIISLSELK